MIAATWGRVRRSRLVDAGLRKLLIILATLLIVVAVFTAGVGVYDAVLAQLPLLLDLWPRLLAGTTAIVALGAWWLWWRLPKQQVARLRHAIRDPKARADVEDNLRKTIGQLLGGAVVLIGAGFAYVQFTQQQQAARDLLISNQVSKGFDQLGSAKVALRLGGIYALAGVMNGSEEYYQPVLEALCAFIRDETRTKTDDDPPATEIQAALTVIGRRKPGPGVVNLSHAHIPKANLRGANLNDTDLRGADLTLANLSGAVLGTVAFVNAAPGANLSGAQLFNTNLSGAFLLSTNLNHAFLNGADLRGAQVTGTDLRGYNLTQGQLDGACGEKNEVNLPLTIKPCPPPSPPPPN